ncbi:hypothetical protein ACJMK2_039419 [Sinanodonta woodiana]|uniref:RBR-type E3 ubiquitin transferase n=1 Tax=Sinanodonta woodiana TaxID=1069815 RepID=A0ABD3WFW0_SINWO
MRTEKTIDGLTIQVRNTGTETTAWNKQGETLERGDIIQIFVKGIDGKTFTIDIRKDASIEELFAAASERTNIHDRDSMRLLYCSKDLRTHENNRRMHLKDYNLKNLSTVFMVLRLRGGSQQERRFAIGARLTDLPDMLRMDDDQGKRALMPCGHAIGPNSLVMFCSNQVESGKFDFRCPDPTCGKRWDYSDIRNIVHLSEEEEVCYETKLTENFVRKSMEFQQCPQCKSLCEKPGKTDICVICPVCTMKKGTRYEFCWYCLKTWSSPNYQRCSNPDCDGIDPRVKFLRNVERKEIGGVRDCPTVRACPKCGLLIEHVDKCKHMDCRCGQKFCFICLRVAINGNWQCGAHNASCNVAPVQQEIPNN